MDQEFANKVKMEYEMEMISNNTSLSTNIYSQIAELQKQTKSMLERIVRAETKIQNMSGGGSSGTEVNIEDIINDPEEFAKRFYFTFIVGAPNIIYDKNLDCYVPQQVGLYVNYNGSEGNQKFLTLNNLRSFLADVNSLSNFVHVNIHIFTKKQNVSKDEFENFTDTEPSEQLELEYGQPNVSVIHINESSDENIIIDLNSDRDNNIYDWIYFELCVEIHIDYELINQQIINQQTIEKYFVDFKTTNFKLGTVEEYDPNITLTADPEPEPAPEPDPNPGQPEPEPEPEPEQKFLMDVEYINYSSWDIFADLLLKLNSTVDLAKLTFDIELTNYAFYELDDENISTSLTTYDEVSGSTSSWVSPYKINENDLVTDIVTVSNNKQIYSVSLQRNDHNMLYRSMEYNCTTWPDDYEIDYIYPFFLISFKNYVYYKTKITLKNIVGYEYNDTAENHIGNSISIPDVITYSRNNDPSDFDIYAIEYLDKITIVLTTMYTLSHLEFDLNMYYCTEPNNTLELIFNGENKNATINTDFEEYATVTAKNNNIYSFVFDNDTSIFGGNNWQTYTYQLCEIDLSNTNIIRGVILSLKNNELHFGDSSIPVKLYNYSELFFEQKEYEYTKDLLESRFKLKLTPSTDIIYNNDRCEFETPSVSVTITYDDNDNNIHQEFNTAGACAAFIRSNDLLNEYINANMVYLFCDISRIERSSSPTFHTYTQDNYAVIQINIWENISFNLNDFEIVNEQEMMYDNIIVSLRLDNKTSSIYTNFKQTQEEIYEDAGNDNNEQTDNNDYTGDNQGGLGEFDNIPTGDHGVTPISGEINPANPNDDSAGKEHASSIEIETGENP